MTQCHIDILQRDARRNTVAPPVAVTSPTEEAGFGGEARIDHVYPESDVTSDAATVPDNAHAARSPTGTTAETETTVS